MNFSSLNRTVLRLVTVAIISTSFVQVSSAGVIGTQQMITTAERQDRLARMELLLARQDVADQLNHYGVAPEMVLERLQQMTSSELLALEGRMDQQVAGGDAVAIVGVVFVVLIILELVGVTDIFKAF